MSTSRNYVRYFHVQKKSNSPQSMSKVLPSWQYFTPSQVTEGGRHIPLAHRNEFVTRQPTGVAKYTTHTHTHTHTHLRAYYLCENVMFISTVDGIR